ncbi:MAG TPA: hypothetical protein VFZ01_18040 [Geminicoccaceae bacterium]
MAMRITTLGLSALLLGGCAGGMAGDEEMAAEGSVAGETMAGETMAEEGMAEGMMHGEAHAHMGHVTDAWEDTPEGMGFLPTARAEAEIAAQHAELAASRPDDLAWMKMHAAHVVNALDPSLEAEGPGLGYGVRPAAEGVAKHIAFASESGDATDNIRLHAGHVETSASNVVEWSEQIIERGRQVEATDSVEEAARLVMEMQAMTDAVLNGIDANGDGQVTWERGEGGIAQAEQHMQFMREGEGIS